MPALKKTIVEMPAMEGLQQKTAAQRLQPGQSAKAINLQKNKQGRLEKRLGLLPLQSVDPFGSGYSISKGLSLGTWNGGSQDSLVIIGSGDRPSSTAVATSIQAYSDDLGGPVLKGPMPEFSVVSDSVVAGAPGGAINPMLAVSGDYALSAWIEVQPTIPNTPQPAFGGLAYMVTQISTGQILVGPTPVDVSSTGSNISCARLDVVGTTFVIAYSRMPSSGVDLNIYARTLTVASLISGGTWSPLPSNAPTAIVSDNVGKWGAFDLRAADSTNFVLAYETGSFNPISGYSTTAIVVTVFPVATLSASATWSVQAAGYQATAFGLRTNTTTNHVVVGYALPSASYSYQVFTAVSSYPSLSALNTPTIIYTPTAANESPPFFLDISLCPGGAGGNENYVESHSPGGAVWNASNLAAQAAQVGGTGATATCGLKGQLASITVTNGGSYNPASPGTIGLQVTDAQGNPGGTWSSANSAGEPQVFLDLTNSHVVVPNGVTPPGSVPTESGTGASLSFSNSIVTATGLSGMTGNYVGLPIQISNSATAGNNGVFTILSEVSSSSVTFFNPQGATDSSGSVHWTTPLPSLIYPLTATFSGGNVTSGGSEATATATLNGGIIQSLFTLTNPGSGYSGSPSITFTSVDGLGSGATAVPVVSGNQVTGWVVTSSGSGYDQPPKITISYPTTTTTTMTQSTQCRLIGFNGTSNLETQNNARIIQNMFFVNTSSGNPVLRYTPVDGYGYCCGDATAPGTGTYQTNACSCITPGLTLASRGLEANGIVYYLGWVPSLTLGSFLVLAFDLAQNPITTGGGSLTGNGFPMRPVATLQTQTALSDPGGGLQTSSIGRQSTTGPNMWTGGSSWFLGTDNYATAYTAYVSSSFTDRLSLAQGVLQTAPARGPLMATWGNLTGIAGAIPTVYDGQNAFEQAMLWSPDSAVVTAASTTVGAGIDFSTATDTYTWILTWEQFDAQGNFHISARSLPITIAGQNLIDAGLVTLGQLTAGVSFEFTFVVPTLGATMRQWPSPQPFGNDLRAFGAPPSEPVSLGVYRTQMNQDVFYRVYDRGFNGNDTGGDSFTLPALVTNTFVSQVSSTAADNQVCTVSMTDGLNDSVITRINAASSLPFPLLYTDGTDGNPGSLDNFGPAASTVICRHKERLFIANGNLVLFTKQRSSEVGPGYNEEVNAIYVGGDDPVTGLASMDDKLIVFKQNHTYYISGDGPADDGTGSNFSDPQSIPTDAGCIIPGSVIPTPEGVYFMSDAGLRLVTRSLAVEYVGGPVEDELSTYPLITGATLYPAANKVIFLANSQDYNATQDIVGEVLVRDYVLDAWTTTQFDNQALGFISTAVAYASGSQGSWNQAPGYAWYTLMSTGQVLRERNPADAHAYYDDFPIHLTYVQSTWLSAPIKMQDLARFRAWDFQVWGNSITPHGIIISTAIDYGTPGLSKTYTWAIIAPGGSTPIPLTQIRSYDGRMGEAFQVQVQDVSDPSSTNGQGFQVLGLSVTTGAYPGQYKLYPGSTQ